MRLNICKSENRSDNTKEIEIRISVCRVVYMFTYLNECLRTRAFRK